MKQYLFAWLMLAGCAALHALTVAVGENPSRLEKIAASELSDFLSRMTGEAVAAVPESQLPGGAPQVIYLGDTAFSRGLKLESGSFGREEWQLKPVGKGALVITGGRPVGTLYGVYAFLDKLGVRFFAPDCTVVPTRKTIDFSGMEERKSPAFAGRNVYTDLPGNLHLNKAPKEEFARYWRWRLRILQNGGHGIASKEIPDAEYLGEYFNLTMSFHTFSFYVDPGLFDAHPEYFSMDRDGKRQKPKSFYAQGSLCVTNPEVARVTLDSLRRYIKRDRAALPEEQWPTIYDISTLDNSPYICFCPACSALAKREGGDAGLVIDFVNRIAKEIRKEYPELKIRTFCYSSAKHVPRSLRPEPNVLIQYCDEFPVSDCYRPLKHEFNRDAMLGNLEKWHASGAKLVLWDYWNMGGRFFDPPRIETVTDAYIDDFKTFRELGIPALFIEGELDWITPQNFMPLNFYLSARLMTDPDADAEAIIAEFIPGYYGEAAAPLMRDYLREIRQGVRSHKTIQRTMRVGNWSFVTPEFLLRYYRRFKETEAALPADSPYRRRLHQEMIPLLWQIVSIEPANFAAAGYSFGDLLQELEADCREFAFRFAPKEPSRLEKQFAAKFEILKAKIPVPAQFAAISPEKRRVYGYPSYRPMPHVYGTVADDPDASCGKALKSSHPDKAYHGGGKIVRSKEGDVAWAFPSAKFEVGCLDIKKEKGIVIDTIPQDEKYHWYRIGRAEISGKTLLWGHCWAIQFELSQAYQLADGVAENNIWDVWIEVKFSGPEWVKGSTRENAVWLDRVVLTEPAKEPEPGVLELPPELARVPREQLTVYTDRKLRELPHMSSTLVADPDASTGRALKSAGTKPEMHGTASKLPLTKFEVGCPDIKTQKNTFIRPVPQDEKYHWYRIPAAQLSPRAYLWGHYWALQCLLGDAYKKDDPAGNIRDVWFAVKFTGPAWVKGSSRENAVWLSGVVLSPRAGL